MEHDIEYDASRDLKRCARCGREWGVIDGIMFGPAAMPECPDDPRVAHAMQIAGVITRMATTVEACIKRDDVDAAMRTAIEGQREVERLLAYGALPTRKGA